MKILVIEDKAIHQESARATLMGHDLTIVASFDEAMDLMYGTIPYEAVLTDMMLPMSKKTLSKDVFRPGEEVPYGFTIALKAALCGAKFVAMITDTNHHKGAISASLDHIADDCGYYPECGFPPNFQINGARVMFQHAPFVERTTEHGLEKTEAKDWGRVLLDLLSSI